MIIKTRSGKDLDVLDRSLDCLDIADGIHAICNTPMFAGQTVKFYSFAEHSCHMHDYIVENFDDVISKFNKDKRGIYDHRSVILDLTKKEILLYALCYNLPYPFMHQVIEQYDGFKKHKSAIINLFLKGLGYSYNNKEDNTNGGCYKKAKPLLEYVDEEVKKDVYLDFYNKDAKYLYFEPNDVVEMYISRFNSVSKYNLYVLNKSEATATLLRYLPKIKKS